MVSDWKTDWVLVNPPPRRRIERDDRPNYPHIGLGYLGAALERFAPGRKLRVIDAKLARLDTKQTVQKILEAGPRILGLTAMTHEIFQAAEVAREVKQALPCVKIIVGGVHATALAPRTLELIPEFDAAFMGEGEQIISRIDSEAFSESMGAGIPGLLSRGENGFVSGPPNPWIENLDELPFPDWSKFPKAEEYPLLSARGCPFKCMFCMRPYGDKVRHRSPENVVEEMELVVDEFQPRMINFYDETFGVNHQRVQKLLELIRLKGLQNRVGWYAITRVDVMNEEILELMKAAGCRMVGFGIESGNPRILEASGKGIDLDRAERIVKYARRIGLFVQTYFILGHPFETRETAQDTINFAARVNGDLTAFGIMVPYPGTKIYEMAKKGEGGYRLLTDDWSAFNKQLGNALELENLPRKELELLQLKGYISVYLRNRRIWDFIRFAWRYRREALAFVLKRLGIKR